MRIPRLTSLLLTVLTLWAVAASLAAEEVLRQNLASGDRVVITSADEPLPATLIQATPRRRSYEQEGMDLGFHIRTGSEITLPMDIRMADMNASHVVGAHGAGTVVRYTGRWQADGGNAFPHLVLMDGARWIFTAESSMDVVMDGSFFTRQLWVYGDGTGVLEFEEGFVADRTANEPLANALGTIRLGGATLLTHHTRNMPANTRPDGRGGHYQNGHVVFERVPGNRWIVDSTNQTYGAQVDFDTDGTIETRASLTHNGHRRVILPVGPGGHFVSSGAFRTTSPDVTITKTGPAMLALDGEQGYLPGSRLVVAEGLVRMATDPWLERTAPGYRDGQPGPHLHVSVESGGRLHLTAPQHRLRRIDAADGARLWLDPDCRLTASEGVHVAPGAVFENRGRVEGPLVVGGTLALFPGQGQAQAEQLELTGGIVAAFGGSAGEEAILQVRGRARIARGPQLSFHDRRGNVPERIVLVEAASLTVGDGVVGRHTCTAGRFSYRILREGNRLVVTEIETVPQ